MSRVEIVIPCYNYGRYLDRCVGSVFAQRDLDVRVLIIDDTSSDDSEEIGRRLARENPRVEYRRHAVNRGHIATYNEGIEWLSGDYFMLLSADDMVIPDSLCELVRYMDEHPGVGLAYGNSIKFSDAVPDADASQFRYEFTSISGDQFIAGVCAALENPISSPAAALVRSDIQRRVGHYEARLPHSGDLEMWLRFAALADVAICEQPIGLYRQHDSNMSTTYIKRPLLALQQHHLTFSTFFEGAGVKVTNSEELWRKVRETLAARAFWAATHAFDRGERAEVASLIEAAGKWNSEVGSTVPWNRFRLKRALGYRLSRIFSRGPEGGAAS